MLEHLSFPTEPRLEHRQDHETTFTVEKWKSMLSAPQLPLQDPAEDQPADDHHVEDQLSHVGLTKEPQIPVSTAPAVIPLLPTLPASSAPPVPPAHSNSAGPSTSTPPPQHSSISPRDFLAIMDAVRHFSVTSTFFAAAHTALAERMARTKVAVSQTTTMLA